MEDVPVLRDLRSDTVTRPTPAMLQAMVYAELGDDVYGDDPSVNALQAKVAELVGKEQGLFVPSGCMSNQLGVMMHSMAARAAGMPFVDVIADKNSHINHYEAGGTASLNQAMMKQIKPAGFHITADEVAEELGQIDDPHLTRTALICVENTIGGRVVPFDQLEAIYKLAQAHNIPVHMDGARIWNASVESGVSLHQYGTVCDSMSLCLSKGLGAPIGSVLVGSAAAIAIARKGRKLLGGGMRQAGVLAACGIHAIDKHFGPVLAQTHADAAWLAQELAKLGFSVQQFTNIIWVDSSSLGIVMAEFSAAAAKKTWKISDGRDGNPHRARLVVHFQAPRSALVELVEVFRECAAAASSRLKSQHSVDSATTAASPPPAKSAA